MKTLSVNKPTFLYFDELAKILYFKLESDVVGKHYKLMKTLSVGDSLPYSERYDSVFNYFAFESNLNIPSTSNLLFLSGDEMKKFFDNKDLMLFLLYHGREL